MARRSISRSSSSCIPPASAHLLSKRFSSTATRPWLQPLPSAQFSCALCSHILGWFLLPANTLATSPLVSARYMNRYSGRKLILNRDKLYGPHKVSSIREVHYRHSCRIAAMVCATADVFIFLSIVSSLRGMAVDTAPDPRFVLNELTSGAAVATVNIPPSLMAVIEGVDATSLRSPPDQFQPYPDPQYSPSSSARWGGYAHSPSL
ncbi:hypothetical protein B0H11DRAFT_2050801 [Mycena galericulata]|nr:hypothetical protein B0H11DRAFT_2050801 [Mycena galericulata]